MLRNGPSPCGAAPRRKGKAGPESPRSALEVREQVPQGPNAAIADAASMRATGVFDILLRTRSHVVLQTSLLLHLFDSGAQSASSWHAFVHRGPSAPNEKQT